MYRWLVLGLTLGAGGVQPGQRIVGLEPAYGDYFGSTVAVRADVAAIGSYGHDAGAKNIGDMIAVGAYWDGRAETPRRRGGVYVYQRSDVGVWTFVQHLGPAEPVVEDDWFGFAVDMTATHLLVGGRHDRGADFSGAGEVHVFDREGDRWALAEVMFAPVRRSGIQYGDAVDAWDHTLLVGAPRDRVGDTVEVGSVQAYQLP